MNLPPHFACRDGELTVEGVALSSVAERFGTPLFVYSKAALIEAYRRYADVVGDRGLVCYAVKANSNLAILDLFARAGAGFDIVSGGELARVLAAGGDAAKVLFSGVGKSRDEMRQALRAGIGCFNVESRAEARQLSAVAVECGIDAPVSLRINPEVDPRTHPYIATGLAGSKFGIAHADALDAYREVARLPGLRIVGIDCHIGSQLLDEAPLLASLEKLIELVDTLDDAGIAIAHLDLGGGVGIAYGSDGEASAIDVGDYLRSVFTRIDGWRAARYGGRPIRVLFEPGRSLVGNAGTMLTRVVVLKSGHEKNFAIVDAAMNDLLRPALYDAWHAVVPVRESADGVEATWDVVGPVCESGDWLARARMLRLAEGGLLAFLSAGAYGMTMASNYNTRPRAAEVLVDGDAVHLVRERETVESLFAGEHRIP